jgi:putative FmdB family regulatory protein
VPTYEYRCATCDRTFDVVQSFHDDALTECPTCGSPVRKVFGNVGIVFKGSGFYKNDSRSTGASKAKEPSGSAGGEGSSGGESSGGDSSAPSTDSSDSKSSSSESKNGSSETTKPAAGESTKPAPTPSGAGSSTS